MKRILLFLVAAVLLPTATASAGLMVKEYVTGSGEMVVLDTVTGNHWYWNLADFVNKTYDQQITAIAGLETYGHIAGGWHMATSAEMLELWGYTGAEIGGGFKPCAQDSFRRFYLGRYALPTPLTPPGHYLAYYEYYKTWGYGFKFPLPSRWVADDSSSPVVGSWVSSGAAVVPVPGSLILAAFGLLTVGAKLRGRRRYGPSSI